MKQFYFIIKQITLWYSCRETKKRKEEGRKGDFNDHVITVSRKELIVFAVFTKQ
jgi:hypothetical protein